MACYISDKRCTSHTLFFLSQEQYVYVYQALIESSQETVIPCSQLRQTFDELCREDKVVEQFEVCISI